MTTHLLVDSHAVAYRVFFGIKQQFSHDDIPTTVLYGFFSQLAYLMGSFQTESFIFAFDFGKGLRKSVYPPYKQGRRKDLSDEDRKKMKELRTQINSLRLGLLRRIGFRNVFFQNGYEADDVIASFCYHSIPKGDDVIIVTSDADLFQLLTDNVIIYNLASKKVITAKSFGKKYGVSPSQWADVKAIAGCKSDNVEGVKGVGDVTACKFLAGTLKPTTKAHESIIKGRDFWERNLPLVQLPYKGTDRFELKKDETTNRKWKKVMKELGIRSLGCEQPFER